MLMSNFSMKRVFIFCIIMIIVGAVPLSIKSIIVGSNTAVSIEALTAFPAADSDNEMRGFAAFDNGFILENSATTCLFNSFFPVSGLITLSNGTLTCARDLFLQGDVEFNAAGTINGAGFSVYTPSLSTAFYWPELPLLELLATQPLLVAINSIDWSYDSAYVAIAVDLSGAHELFVYSFNGTTLTFQASVELGQDANAVRWHPSNYFLSVGRSNGAGSEFYIYEFIPGGPSLNIKGNTSLAGQNTLAVAWRPSGSHVAFSSSANPEVRVVPVDGAGALGTIITDGTPTGAVQRNAMSWDWSGNYFAVGLANNASNELLIYNFNGVALSVPAAAEIGATVSALDWSKTNSLIAIGLTGSSAENIRVYAFNAPSSLVEITAKFTDEIADILAIQWHPSGISLAVAYAVGAGSEVYIYDFNMISSELLAKHKIGVFGTVNALRWSPNGSYLAIGGSTGILGVYANDATALDDFIFQDTTIVLRSDLNIEAPYVFKGACVIEGNGYTIDCTDINISVDSGASLSIRNATVHGVIEGSIVCADSAASLILQDVIWDQHADYTFAQGVLNIIGKVTMIGPYVFAYTSSEIINIRHDSEWFFDSGMTFSYAPTDGVNNLLTMADTTSLLHLYESTLYAPSAGLQFTKGKVVIEGVCPVISDAVSEANGILFGDGVSSINNAQLNVLPESKFTLNSGYLVYQNV